MTKKLCLEEGCETTQASRGLCNKHYMSHRYAGTLDQFGGEIIRHLLTDVDPVSKTGTCSVCGEGQKIIRRGKYWRCVVKTQRGKMTYDGGKIISRKEIEETFAKLNSEQQGLCAKCGRTCDTYSTLSIDHCHTTGKIRGLLCNKCNTGIGLLGDNIEGLQAALNYLIKSEEI